MNSHASLPSSASPFPGFPSLDLSAILGTLVERWRLVAAVFAAFTGAGLAYLFFLAEYQYRAEALVFVEREQVLSENIRSVLADDYSGLDSLKSLERSMISGAVILRVVDHLGLRDDPGFLKPRKDGRPWSDAEIVERVSKRVKATLERGTRLIVIEVKDTSPERARDLAEAFVTQFEAHMMEQSLDSAQRATAMLRQQAERQLERLTRSEDILQEFREAHPDLPLEEGGIVDKRLDDLDRLLSEAKNERLRLEAEARKLESLDPSEPEAFLEIGSYVNAEHIGKLLLARNQKRAEMVRIQRQYEPGHPAYIAHLAELEGLEAEVAETARAVGETIRRRLETAIGHEEELSRIVDEQKREVLAADRKRKEFRALRQQVDADTQTYHSLLARVSETDVTEGVRESIIRMEQPPLVPVKPSSPKKKVIMLLAGALGLMAGAGGVLLLSLLDRSLRTRRQVEQTLGLPVLAEIVSAPEAGESLRDSLVVFSEPHSLGAESFRSLRLSLSALSPRSVLLASAMPGEGKSFCAANLALLQAQLGYRTLLVDADFHRPELSEALLPAPEGAGAGEGALEAKNLCQRTPFPHLYLISCARYAPLTGEAMSGEQFAAMLWEAYRSFDCVIIDTSPLGLVSEALTFARYADAVVLVARAGTTQTGDALTACRELRRLRVPLAGCILNGTQADERSKAYFETYRPAASRRPTMALPMGAAS